MAMGKRRRRARQKTMWVASTDLPQSAGHPFYERLNRLLVLLLSRHYLLLTNGLTPNLRDEGTCQINNRL